ncbi:FAD-dependent oxidoreductase [Paraflavitalea pollutisoli]|uniref:FAD-dependent oxidoreductase n=1 Tax=Paraflavitalea pollutisoli TaxID=3034143 RepID=UPI0023EB5721|nr:NAD(P)/FAD-dependent oxidoreductase [Paraflavitalea sp. H1-2-19X]
MTAIRTKQIAIIGGGPGGLTLARLLQQQGVSVQVYERDASRQVRVQGATLDLHQESGLRALEAAGLLDAFKANYRPGADRMRIANAQGELVFDDHAVKEDAAFDSAHFRPEIDRGPLRDILLDSLQPGTVVWDCNFKALTPFGDGWMIHFQQGEAVYADIVIGADGANSKIRPYVTSIGPFYSGYTVVEGSVYEAATQAPYWHELVVGGKLFAMGHQQTLILSAKGDGSLSFYTGCRMPADWVTRSGIDYSNRHEVLAWFKREFPQWSPVWYELFDNDQVHFVVRPQYCMPLDQVWDAQANITLLGDAAHLMPPYAGEGVNMAMLDALELCNCLAEERFSDTRTAIEQYEVAMRARASATAALTLAQTDALHAEGALAYLVGMMKGA